MVAGRRRVTAGLLALVSGLAAAPVQSQAVPSGLSAIAQAAGNPFMISTLDYLAQFLKGATRVTRANEARRADFADAVTHEHTQIVLAIEAGDAVAARAAAASCTAASRAV